MKRFIKPCNINRVMIAPASKSFAQRALIASLLSSGESHLTGFSLCDDTLAAIEVIRSLGAHVEIREDFCHVKSSFDLERYTPQRMECGESGLLARLTIAIMSLFDRETMINGSGTLINRSFAGMERPLRELGAEISFRDGKLPAIVKWGMKGGQTTIDGSGGSQILTALLMMLPLTPRGGDIFVVDLTSKPYIDMTIDLMSAFGVEVERDGYQRFGVQGGTKYKSANYNIEGDWSSAAALLVAGALAGEVTVENLTIKSLQADKKVLELLLSAGVSTTIDFNSITTRRSNIGQFYFDATDCPDLFPSAVALATGADGICAIKGVQRLFNKESNRAEVLKNEYAKIGIAISIEGDTMVITPGEVIGGSIDSQNDHRIAMSLAVVGLISKNGIEINGAEAVNKSYPNFWKELELF